jgi:hypothetical protein
MKKRNFCLNKSLNTTIIKYGFIKEASFNKIIDLGLLLNAMDLMLKALRNKLIQNYP